MNTTFNSLNSYAITQAGHNFLVKGMTSRDDLTEYCLVYIARGRVLSKGHSMGNWSEIRDNMDHQGSERHKKHRGAKLWR